MTRSERLAQELKVECRVLGGFEICNVVLPADIYGGKIKARYICTDFEALYNGTEYQADIYEDCNSNDLYAILRF